MKKINNFVSNCSRYMVKPFFLEVLMSSFERYPSKIVTTNIATYKETTHNNTTYKVYDVISLHLPKAIVKNLLL